MKKNISNGAAGAIIAVVVVIALVVGFRLLRDPAGSLDGQMPPQMPPDVAAEFGRRMSQVKMPITPGAPLPGKTGAVQGKPTEAKPAK